jgi:hypothetical protein
MLDFHSIDAWFDRRRRGALAAVALAAVFVSAPVQGASSVETADPAETASIAPGAAHEVRIKQTKPGREGFELAARLVEDGGLITLPVGWTVKNMDGEKIFDGKAPVADIVAPPGDYAVTVKYGTVTVEQSVTLLEAQQLGVVFTLNVGGIRVLPRVEGIGLPGLKSETAIYALGGIARGQRVAASALPGEIIRVGSGAYRVETRFTPGNAVASADIVVKPGLMSAVEIDHAAGLARLSVPDASPSEVSWIVRDERGDELPKIEAISADVVLKPGRYLVSVLVDGVERATRFEIAAGETRAIIVGN